MEPTDDKYDNSNQATYNSKPPKSIALAILLTVFLGPLGMTYSTISGALCMAVLSTLAIVFTGGFGLYVTWPLCIVWAGIAARVA